MAMKELFHMTPNYFPGHEIRLVIEEPIDSSWAYTDYVDYGQPAYLWSQDGYKPNPLYRWTLFNGIFRYTFYGYNWYAQDIDKDGLDKVDPSFEIIINLLPSDKSYFLFNRRTKKLKAYQSSEIQSWLTGPPYFQVGFILVKPIGKLKQKIEVYEHLPKDFEKTIPLLRKSSNAKSQAKLELYEAGQNLIRRFALVFPNSKSTAEISIAALRPLLDNSQFIVVKCRGTHGFGLTVYSMIRHGEAFRRIAAKYCSNRGIDLKEMLPGENVFL